MDKSEQFYLEFLDENNNSKDKYIELHDCGTTTELIAKQFDGNFSFITTISTACSSALNAVILGANLIKTGRADIAIVGGTECISKFHFNGFNTLMILDKQQCRPFDKTRAGLNLGEGAAYLVLESEKSVKSRGIKPLCKLLGYANTCDAYHQTATSPEGIGATLAMKKAIEKSNLLPEDINYINAHGTGTDNNDLTEGIAVMNVFENNVPNISSLKSFLGHTTSAAGSVEAVISILAMINNFVPANLNFKTKIDELNFSPNNKNILNTEIKSFITNSFGFGGNDTACVFEK
jgi:3-oxoacyl-[acyl-carrier-protein] synthase-1